MASQFESLCCSYRTQTFSLTSASDPLIKEWWEAADLYLDMLRQIAKEAKKAVPADPYSVASVNRLLLQALVTGISKTVSYTEIEAVCNEMTSSAAACAAWAPPTWRADMQTDKKVVTDAVLPFLRKANCSSYKPAIVNVDDTPGFLDIYTKAVAKISATKRKSCALCGMEADDLLKCSACQSVWYCDRECQTQGWKSHKIECKEAQKRANNAAAWGISV